MPKVTVVTGARGLFGAIFSEVMGQDPHGCILLGCRLETWRESGNFGFSTKGSYNFGNTFGGLKIDA